MARACAAQPLRLVARQTLAPRSGFAAMRGMSSQTPKADVKEGGTALDYSFEGPAFQGNKDQIVRRLKMASVANLGFAAASAPVLQYITSMSGNGVHVCSRPAVAR